jgi:hypothetical protein
LLNKNCQEFADNIYGFFWNQHFCLGFSNTFVHCIDLLYNLSV